MASKHAPRGAKRRHSVRNAKKRPKPRASDVHRSRIMRAVRRTRTAPEESVAEAFRASRLRFRRNVPSLPGSPDFANKSRRIAVFVHGCYWHRHPGCRLTTSPKHNEGFWREKFSSNVRRDKQITIALQRLGYKVAVIWECETRNSTALRRRAKAILRHWK